MLNLNKSVLNCSCILAYFFSNYGSFDDQCPVAMATLAYEICLKTVYFAAKVKNKHGDPQLFFAHYFSYKIS